MAKNMTEGKPLKLILAFMFPVLCGNLFQNFYNIVDSMIVGRFLGVDALAAVGSTTSLNFLVVGWITGMTSGFGILISQAYGAKDEKRLRHYVAMSTYLCVILAIIMTTGLLLANGWILTTMNTPEKFMQIHGNILRLFMRDFRQRFFTICLLRLQDLWETARHRLFFLCYLLF